MINCYICGKKVSLKNDIKVLSNRMILCNQCFKDNNGFECKYCNLVYIGRDYNQTEQCCKYCYEGMKSQINNQKLRFHNYHYKPYPIFYPKKIKNVLYLGIQLEVGGVHDYHIVNKFAAYNENNFFYIKKDSTIPKYGCEIVTYPATLQYHLKNKTKWQKILNSAKINKFKSYDIHDCGLHIHINKNFFNDAEIAKLDQFINTNKKLFECISRRQSEFSRFLNKPIDLYGKPINYNRHCALNLCPQDTIQFRMFKGTIKYESIMAYLEFVHCLCYYIKENNNINKQQFINYLNKQQTLYLKDFISNKIKE